MHLALALVELFDLRALQRLLLRLGDAGQDIADGVTWQAGLTHAAFEVAEALFDRGLVGDDLFHALLEERPLRAARIKELADQVAVPWSPEEASRAARDDLLQLSLLLRDAVRPHELREALERLGEPGQAVSRDVAWEAGHSQAAFEAARLLVQQGLVGKPLFQALREDRGADEAERIIAAAARFGVKGLVPAGLPAGRKAWGRLLRRVAVGAVVAGTTLFLGIRLTAPPLEPRVSVGKREWSAQVVPAQAEVSCRAVGPGRSEVRWTSREAEGQSDWQQGEASLDARPGEGWTCEARDPWFLRGPGSRTIEVNEPPPPVTPTISLDRGRVSCTVEAPPDTQVDLRWTLVAEGAPVLVREPEVSEVLADGRHRRMDRLPPGTWLCTATVTDAQGDQGRALREYTVPCQATFDGVAPLRPAEVSTVPGLSWTEGEPDALVVRLRTLDAGRGWRREIHVDGASEPIWADTGPRAIGGAITRAQVQGARAAWGRRLDASAWTALERGLLARCKDLARQATEGDPT